MICKSIKKWHSLCLGIQTYKGKTEEEKIWTMFSLPTGAVLAVDVYGGNFGAAHRNGK